MALTLLLLCSCNNSSQTSTSNQNPETTIESTESSSKKPRDRKESSKESTKESTEVETTESESTPEETTTEESIDIYADRNVYEPKTVANDDGTNTLYYLTYELNEPAFLPYYHNYQAAISFTFDDGYDTGTGVFVTDVFKTYDFRGTAMLGPCFLDDSKNEVWRQVFAQGYLDAGCHGYNHLNPVGLDPSKYEHEIKDAQDYLRAAFPGQNVLAFATPLAHIDNSYESYLKQYFLSDRLEADGSLVALGTDFNMMRIKSYSFNKGQNGAQIGSVKTNLDNAVAKGKWATVLCHCVLDNPSNSTDVSKTDFLELCRYLYNTYYGKVWFCSFEEATIYQYQLMNAKINYTACDNESMTFTVTCDLDENIYNIPMSATIYVPSFVSTAYAVIDGVEQDLEVTKILGKKAVNVVDIPVNGSEVKIYLGENSNIDNDCDHDLVTLETVEPTCHSHGYTVKGCRVCNFTYKVRYTRMSDHDFTGKVTEVTEATAAIPGLDLIQCKNCTAQKRELYTFN